MGIAILTINMKTFTRVIFFICYFSHLGVEGSVLIKTPKKTWIAKMKKGNPSNQRKTPHSRASMKDYYLQLEKKECIQRYRNSYKHYTYRNYTTCSSVDGCFEECKKISWCNSVSYTYVSYIKLPGNCLLSDTRVENLRDPEDFNKNSFWTIYRVDRGSSCSRNRSKIRAFTKTK